MKKQTKMEYVSPSIAEIELLTDFMDQVANSQDLPEMDVNDLDKETNPDHDFWG